MSPAELVDAAANALVGLCRPWACQDMWRRERRKKLGSCLSWERDGGIHLKQRQLSRNFYSNGAFGGWESGEGLFPPPSHVSFVFRILVPTLGMMENLYGFKTTETHRFIQRSYEG